MPLVSISNAQRLPGAKREFRGDRLSWVAASLHRPSKEPEVISHFLDAFLTEKRPDRAIRLPALESPHKIAAKVDRADDVYFKTRDRATHQGPVLSLSRIDEHQKTRFLVEAQALFVFCPIGRSRFGLSMIEAMACGTPVLAFSLRLSAGDHRRRDHRWHRQQHGRGDFGAAAHHRARSEKGAQTLRATLSSATRMAKDYVGVYHSLLASSKACGH